MKDDYTQLTSEQLSEAYEYYLKEIIRLLDKVNNTTIFPTSQDKIKFIKTSSEINKIRKIQGKKSIIIKQSNVGFKSAYLEFF